MTRHIRRLAGALRALPVCLLGATASMPAFADSKSIDYDALEQIFEEPITTSATGSPQRVSEVPATMVIITAEDIRRSGARDIPGVLRQVGGVNVLLTSNDHADVSVRGYNQPFSPRLLVLVDGRQVYADYYGFTPWSAVPVELAAIRQIEVVKGPNSALFGFNAVGGVINIITYDAINDTVNSVSVSGGTQSLAQGSLVSTWHIGDSAGVQLTAGYRDNDDFSTTVLPAEAGLRRGNKRGAISLSAEIDLSETVRAGLDATYSDARQAEFTPLFMLSHDDFETNSVEGHINADTSIGLIAASVYSNRIVSNVFIDDSAAPFVTFDNRVTVAKLQSISKFGGRNTLRLTTEYRNNSMATTPIGGGNVFYDVAAIGGMWEWRVDPAVTLTGALRLDRWSLGRSGTTPAGYGLTNEDWDRTLTEPSYNFAAVWQASDADTVRLTMGRGVQLPNLVQLGSFVFALPQFGYASGDPDLDPTVIDNYELSWDRSLSRLAAQLRVSVFYGRTDDIVAAAGGMRVADGLLALPLTIGESTTAGIEVSIDSARHNEWRWEFNYKYQRINDAFDPFLPVEVIHEDFEDATPRHVVKASAGWVHGRWTVDGFIVFQSAFSGIRSAAFLVPDIQLLPVPGHTVVDGRIAYSLTDRIEIALSGRNLTGTARQSAAPNVERAFFATLSGSFGRRE